MGRTGVSWPLCSGLPKATSSSQHQGGPPTAGWLAGRSAEVREELGGGGSRRGELAA